MRALCLAFALLFPLEVWAQPNMRYVVEEVAQHYPHVFALAHKDYGEQGLPGKTTKAQAELFVRLVGWELHANYDSSWGLNGKRGNANDLSQDVISYRLADNWNQGFDIIAGAGGPSPSIVWNAFPSPGTDTDGRWVQPQFISQAEIDAILAGGTPPPPTIQTMALGDAANRIFETFQRVHERAPEQAEIEAMAAFARANGWDGGDRIAAAIVDAVVLYVSRYSGDLSNPFPTVNPAAALLQINEAFLDRLGRYPREVELRALGVYATSLGWNWQGDVPLWLLQTLLVAISHYDGLYGIHLAGPVEGQSELHVLSSGFGVDGRRMEWRGITAFLLFYDYTFNRAQYVRFRDAAAWNKVRVVRVSVGTSSGYLKLQPQSGGTFGLGRTTPLFPGSPHWSWDAYRAMVADLNARGIVPEIVPFLTTGPEDTDDPRMGSAAGRAAYLEDVARELLPARAAFVEIANEYNFIGFPNDGQEIVDLWQRYKLLDPLRLVALSAPAPPHSIPLMAQGDYVTVHADRSVTPYSFTWVLRQFELPQHAFGKPVINDEGINADTVGEFGADADPRNHFINGVTTQLLKMSYTFHYDRALKGLEPSSADGSLQAFEAWRAGLDLVSFDTEGQLYQATALGATPGFPFESLGGAVASAGRLGETSGVFAFYGTPDGFVVPASPGWSVELMANVGTHHVYRLTRIVQ